MTVYRFCIKSAAVCLQQLTYQRCQHLFRTVYIHTDTVTNVCQLLLASTGKCSESNKGKVWITTVNWKVDN